MDDDSDSTSWVLVNEIDCAEEALESFDSSVAAIVVVADSDQESDGSISIISDHPTDSYSEEENDIPKKNEAEATKILPVIKIDTDYEAGGNQEDIKDQDQKIGHVELLEKDQDGEEIKDVPVVDLTDVDDDASSFSDPLSRQWIFADDKSKLEMDTSHKTFFLDCSQEPILEVSSNDADMDNGSTTSSSECQAIVQKVETPIPNISPRDPLRDRDSYINRVSIGFLISMLILTSSHLIRQYLDYTDDGLQSPSPSSGFLDSIADSEKARPILDFCIDKQKAKGGEYIDHAVEKCVVKKLRKKNREEALKKTEIYLQMRERILELREKELAEKEKQILQKMRKRLYNTEAKEETINSIEKPKENKGITSIEWKKKSKRSFDPNKVRNQKTQDNFPEKENKIKDKDKTFPKKNSWFFQKGKEPLNWDPKLDSKDSFNSKKIQKDNEKMLKQIKEKVKGFHKKSKKVDKKEDPNEEWYIKYNPVKNTIELINITTLPKEDSTSIRNGNKTVNGQWYFSLYGTSRANFRHKEKAAEWYFRRSNFREHKRDKAKWYFDYMSARDNTRYFY